MNLELSTIIDPFLILFSYFNKLLLLSFLKSIPKILLFLIFSHKEDYSKALSSSYIKSKINLFFFILLINKLLIFSLTENY